MKKKSKKALILALVRRYLRLVDECRKNGGKRIEILVALCRAEAWLELGVKGASEMIRKRLHPNLNERQAMNMYTAVRMCMFDSRWLTALKKGEICETHARFAWPLTFIGDSVMSKAWLDNAKRMDSMLFFAWTRAQRAGVAVDGKIAMTEHDFVHMSLTLPALYKERIRLMQRRMIREDGSRPSREDIVCSALDALAKALDRKK